MGLNMPGTKKGSIQSIAGSYDDYLISLIHPFSDARMTSEFPSQGNVLPFQVPFDLERTGTKVADFFDDTEALQSLVRGMQIVSAILHRFRLGRTSAVEDENNRVPSLQEFFCVEQCVERSR